MEKVKPYQLEKDKVFATGESQYLKAARVKTGKILKVTHIAGSFENVGTSEFVVLGYWNGHAYVPLKKGSPPEAGDLVHWDGEVYLREQQYVYAYFADVANGEKMKLRGNGKFE